MSEPVIDTAAANTTDVRNRYVHTHTDTTASAAAFDRWLSALLAEARAEALREVADDMDAQYEARTAKVGAYGQMKIRAALRLGATLVRNRANLEEA